MVDILNHRKEAIRINAKRIDAIHSSETLRFSIDPELTSLAVLQSILSKAFDLQENFAIYYRREEQLESYSPIITDYDLDKAFLQTHNISLQTSCEPCLNIQIDTNVSIFPQNGRNLWFLHQRQQQSLPSTRQIAGIFNQMSKSFTNKVQKALLVNNNNHPYYSNDMEDSHQRHPSLSDVEFRKFLDPVGQIVYAKELRKFIYLGGVEPSLRKVVWKHILNVYPDALTGRERMDYMKTKSLEYKQLRNTWMEAVANGRHSEELLHTTGMVRKDVLRTDRQHPFYAGSDDNVNVAALFNILTTYALNHPKISYCQGMSDLASPLLVTMGDEAHAYICFCALMRRLCTNFQMDGISMTQKFQHLALGLAHYDPQFYNYLKLQQADDLLFCYRWLLLEMKREFAFDDSLRMLEVLWSALPLEMTSSPIDLPLYDTKYTILSSTTQSSSSTSSALSTSSSSENVFFRKVCELRRQTSFSSTITAKSHPVKVCNSVTNLIKHSTNNGRTKTSASLSDLDSVVRRVKNLNEFHNFSSTMTLEANNNKWEELIEINDTDPTDEVFLWENPLHGGEASPKTTTGTAGSSCKMMVADDERIRNSNNKLCMLKGEDVHQLKVALNSLLSNLYDDEKRKEKETGELLLPSPSDFGGGNPLLMFLAIAILVQHRDYIMSRRLDYNEIAMHFDKMIRRHNLNRVLNHARYMYDDYMRRQHKKGT